MLTRRHIRIKVVQSMYSFIASKDDLIENEILFFKKSILGTFELYFLLLSVFNSVYNYSKEKLKSLEKAQLDVSLQNSSHNKFLNNKFLNFILICFKSNYSKASQLQNEWDLEFKYPRLILEDLFNSKFFKEYESIDEPNIEEQRKLMTVLFKEIIVPSVYLYDHIIDRKLTWQDDLPLVNTFILKQIKGIDLKKKNSFKLSNINQYEDDIDFGKKLLNLSISKDNDLQSELKGKTPNWDSKRIAQLDLIILKVAIAEILNFSSIPTKVSINEYIEIAKDYSTPKSDNFINGVLDKLVKEFEVDKRLNKTRRGLE